jgi:hypothetical protein
VISGVLQVLGHAFPEGEHRRHLLERDEVGANLEREAQRLDDEHGARIVRALA